MNAGCSAVLLLSVLGQVNPINSTGLLAARNAEIHASMLSEIPEAVKEEIVAFSSLSGAVKFLLKRLFTRG